MKPKILLISLLILVSSFSIHKYYLSYTSIFYNTDNKSLEITMRVFIDDIEKVLNNNNNIDLQLNTDDELAENDKYFKNYIENHFKVKVNGKHKKFNYIAKKYDADAVKIFLEIEKIKKIKSIEIDSKILTKDFDNQQNVIKIKINDTKKSYILDKDNHISSLNF